MSHIHIIYTDIIQILVIYRYKNYSRYAVYTCVHTFANQIFIMHSFEIKIGLIFKL